MFLILFFVINIYFIKDLKYFVILLKKFLKKVIFIISIKEKKLF